MPHRALTAEFLLGFLESYPGAVTVFELDGTMVYVNRHGCDLLRMTKEELEGKHIQDLVANPTMIEGFIGRIILKGYVEGEVNIAQGDGNTVKVRLAGVLVKDEAGRPMGILGMAIGTDAVLAHADEAVPSVQRILAQLPDARMLTVEEVAKELRVSKETVRRWVRSGQLPCIKLPRGIRIPSEVIKDMIRANFRQEANTHAPGGGSASAGQSTR